MNLAQLLMVAAHAAEAAPAGVPGEPTNVTTYIYAGSKYGISWDNSADLPGTCVTDIDSDGDGIADDTVSTAITNKDLGTTTFPADAQVRHRNANGSSAWVGLGAG